MKFILDLKWGRLDKGLVISIVHCRFGFLSANGIHQVQFALSSLHIPKFHIRVLIFRNQESIIVLNTAPST